MSVAEKLAKWVTNKPMMLIRFDDESSDALRESRQGFEHFTFVKPHSSLQGFKVPTLCLLEIQEWEETKCYLGVVTRKIAVSTFDSRLTIKKLRSVTPVSLAKLQEMITDTRMIRLLSERSPGVGGFSILSPKLSAYIIGKLAGNSNNQGALDTAYSLLPGLRRVPNVNWAQENAIQTAINAFGIIGNAIPDQVILKQNTSSGLGLIGAHLYEDNVVHADASNLPGFDAIAPDVTGRAVFTKRGEKLVIYTANKLPLEKMLGVDLIYINETRGNIVMIQYKMLEENNNKDGSKDWLFRPDKQLHDEIDRMKIPKVEGDITDYRLNSNPFYFKFVKRKIVDDSHQSFLLSLDHLNHLLTSSEVKGPKDGVRLSYEKLDGTYLREADIISLIRSGYIGTHRSETEALAVIIDEVARGNKALVLAWQQKIEDIKRDDVEED